MWVKLHDGFGDNQKIEGLSNAAFRVYVLGLVYAGRNVTDGFVPCSQPARSVRKYRSQFVAELVASGLWEPVENGWIIHDFLDWNPSAATVQAERERVRAWRENQKRTRTETRTESVANDVPTRPVVLKESCSGLTPSNGASAPPSTAEAPPGTEPPPLKPSFLPGSGWIAPPEPEPQPLTDEERAANLAAIKAARTKRTGHK